MQESDVARIGASEKDLTCNKRHNKKHWTILKKRKNVHKALLD